MSDHHDERRIEALQEEVGEWQASDDGSHIYSDRFETDAMLVLSGCFGSVEKRKRYADQIARDLSEITALRAALDQERADGAKLRAAAKVADWEQVRLNGGPPCFHIEESEFRKDCAPDVLDYRFCFRAERWPGHPTLHKFVTIHDAIRAAKRDGNG